MGDPPPPDPAQPEPGQPAGPGPAPAAPAGAGAGAPARGGNAARKSGISGPLIGAGATIVAAIIGGVFLLIVAFHHTGNSGGGGGSTTQPSTPAAQASGPATIQSVKWSRPVNGLQIVTVQGTEQGLTIGEIIYAMAGRNQNTPPFYYSVPVRPNSNGTWLAAIKTIPASVRSLTFWPSVASSALSSSCPFACATAVYAKYGREIAARGPHAGFLKHVGPPVRSHAPGG